MRRRRTFEKYLKGIERARLRKEGPAFHEAGHPVAALALGFGVEFVTIMPDRTRGNEEWYSVGRTKTLLPLSQLILSKPEDCAIFLLAGVAAERKFSGIRRRIGGSDLANLEITVSGFEIPRLMQRASELVEKHWTEIVELSQNLLRNRTIVAPQMKAPPTPHDSH